MLVYPFHRCAAVPLETPEPPAGRHPKTRCRYELQAADYGKCPSITDCGDEHTCHDRPAGMPDIHDGPAQSHTGSDVLGFSQIRDHRGR